MFVYSEMKNIEKLFESIERLAERFLKQAVKEKAQ